ncbi:MAG: polymerase sigma-54 factor, partial [Chloroflexia bacterium]|nr:polymerase sigma-54 factor [Chloroflexia bacterium]
MDISLDLIQEQSARVSPTLIAVNHVLALSSQELQNLIKQEAEENPAFDIVEHHTCTICGEVLKNGVCLNCIRNTSATSTPQASNPDDFGYGSTTYRDEEIDNPSYSPMGDDEEFDPVSLVAAEPTMRERLMLDLRSALPPNEFDIAEYILGNLDDKGFLAVSVDTLAEELNAPMEQVERILGVVQRLGPPGICARDPRECLLLQLEQMELDGEQVPPHVRDILESYFIELGEHKYVQIA